jgi:hypothetical protein
MWGKFLALSIGRKLALGAASLFTVGAVGAATGPAPTPTPAAAAPQVITKSEVQTKAVAFTTQTVADAVLPTGQQAVKQEGKEGVETLTYEVTYSDGKEVARKLASDTVTTQPVPKIVANGTYVAPKQSTSGLSNNNTYTNVNGNTVHSPAYSATVPSGATARCGDGTYSFSQHRSGTCSHHGGVATWL